MKKFFKLFLCIGIMSGIPFGLLFGIAFGLRFNLGFLKSLIVGLGSGVSFGVLFGLIFSIFLTIFERREISLFAYPKFHYITSIISAIIGIIVMLTKFHILSYISGVMVALPFYYWVKIGLGKKVDIYATFYQTPIEKRLFSKKLQKANMRTSFPLFIGSLILFVIISKIKGSIIVAIFGFMLWSFIWAPEYKLIYGRAKDTMSKK